MMYKPNQNRHIFKDQGGYAASGFFSLIFFFWHSNCIGTMVYFDLVYAWNYPSWRVCRYVRYSSPDLDMEFMDIGKRDRRFIPNFFFDSTREYRVEIG